MISSMIRILLAVVAFNCLHFAVSINCTISQQSFDALQDLYESTQGNNWTWPSGSIPWQFPSPLTDPCSLPWNGLACYIDSSSSDESVCLIEIIDLVKHNLRGPLPESLYHITSLVELVFTLNHLEGSISSSIALLTKLDTLNACENRFTGTIPSYIGNLHQLELLELCFNRFSGTIPTEIGYLTNLLFVELRGNRFNGKIPTEIGNLIQLTWLDISNNNFEGSIPNELYNNVPFMHALFASDNKLTGTIFSNISNWKDLELFEMYTNSLEGTIPTEVGICAKLTGFLLYENMLTGTIPTELGNLADVVQLYLNTNYLSGTVPQNTTRWHNALQDLTLSYNLLTGTLRAYNWTMMSMLSLSSNYFTGTIFDTFVSYDSIFKISLSTNYLSGALPHWILVSCTNMDLLYLDNNLLTGSALSRFTNNSAIVDMYISNNFLTSSLPNELYTNIVLGEFFVDNNLLTGTIPPIDLARRLREFDVHNNRFVGPIAEFTQTCSLGTIDMSFNSLTGAIPYSLWLYSPTLRKFNVSFNQLTYIESNSSSLSSAIAIPLNLYLLQTISMSNNLLTSSFPSFLCDYKTSVILESIMISSNYFSGEINANIGELSLIRAIEMSNNFFSGSIPITFQMLSLLKLINMSTNLLTGKLDNIFNETDNLQSIQLIDFSLNAFIGTLPNALFDSNKRSNLSDILLFSNCFSGSIPLAICDASSVNVLILDSLVSGDSCQRKFPIAFLDSVFKVRLSKRQLIGGIPSCIWSSMRALQTLHLAGNGLTGKLFDFGEENSFIDISLSSNNLIGSIPLSWQLSKQLKSIDLASNKLNGILNSNLQMGINSSINLSVNRLSGAIPITLINSVNSVDILDENLFQCSNNINRRSSLDSDQMPKTDPFASTYICGSSSYDLSLIVSVIAVAVVVCVAIALAAFVRSQQQSQQSNDIKEHQRQEADRERDSSDVSMFLSFDYRQLYRQFQHFRVLLQQSLVTDLSHQPKTAANAVAAAAAAAASPQRKSLLLFPYSFVVFWEYLTKIRFYITSASVVVLLLLLPLYLLIKSVESLSRLYSTHTYQYLWIASAAFLHGTLPYLVTLFVVFVLLAWVAKVLFSKQYWINRKSIGGIHSNRCTNTLQELVEEGGNGNSNGNGNGNSNSNSTRDQHARQSQIATIDNPLFNSKAIIKGSNSEAAITTIPIATSTQAELSTKSLGTSPIIAFTMRKRAYVGIVVVAHMVVIMTINIFYVLLTLIGLPESKLFIVQLSLSVFKVVWNNIAVPYSLKKALKSLDAAYLSYSLFLSLFIFLASPFIATFFTSDSCFRYIITGLTPVTSSFYVKQFKCEVLCHNIECVDVCDVTKTADLVVYSSVEPSWLYSYQCSSSLLINYIPVLTYSVIISGIAIPFLKFLVISNCRSWDLQLRYLGIVATESSTVPEPTSASPSASGLGFGYSSGLASPSELTCQSVSGSSSMLDSGSGSGSGSSGMGSGSGAGSSGMGSGSGAGSGSGSSSSVTGSGSGSGSGIRSGIGPSSGGTCSGSVNASLLERSVGFIAGVIDKLPTPNHYFNGNAYLIRIYLNLGMLLTFGVASPLLCISILIDSWSNILVLRLFVSKISLVMQARLSDSLSATEYNVTIVSFRSMLVNSICKVDKANVRISFLMIYFVVIVFWALFGFDMMGDVYGEAVGCISLFGLLLCSIVFGLAYYICLRLFGLNNSGNGNYDTNSIVFSGIELNELFHSNSS